MSLRVRCSRRGPAACRVAAAVAALTALVAAQVQLPQRLRQAASGMGAGTKRAEAQLHLAVSPPEDDD